MKSRTFVRTLALVAALAWVIGLAVPHALSALEPPSGVPGLRPTQGAVDAATPAKRATWNFLIFMCDTNDLYPYGPLTIKQLKKVGSTADVNVLILRGYMKKDRPSEKLLVRKGQVEVLETLPKVDMGDWRELVKFVRWAQAAYPADRTLVDLWNHGGAWYDEEAVVSSPLPAKPKGIAYDDLSGNHITNFQLRQAMAEIKKILGHDLDLLAMDACLMQTIEIAGELRESVGCTVAAEEVEPGTGWPYDRVAARLVARPGMSAAEFAGTIVSEHKAAYLPKKDEATTCSAIRMDKVAAVTAKAEALGRALKAGLADPATLAALEAAAKKVQRFDEGEQVDLVHLCILLRSRVKNPALLLAVNSLLDALIGPQGLVFANGVTGAAMKNAGGLAIYLPNTAIEPQYARVTAFGGGAWGDFLAAWRGVAKPAKSDRIPDLDLK